MMAFSEKAHLHTPKPDEHMTMWLQGSPKLNA